MDSQSEPAGNPQFDHNQFIATGKCSSRYPCRGNSIPVGFNFPAADAPSVSVVPLFDLYPGALDNLGPLGNLGFHEWLDIHQRHG